MKNALILILLLVIQPALAQNTIKGKITDEHGEPIMFATIQIGDSAVATTDMEGDFELHRLRNKIYDIRFSFVGYMPKNKIVEFKKDSGQVIHLDIKLEQGRVLLKPAIYMYNESELSVTIQLSNPSELIFTLPPYQDKWNVILKDGVIKGENYKTYDYLYWEGVSYSRTKLQVNHDQGFCVKSSESTDFLEKQLDILGLNDREKNDFIAFWGPKISANAFSKIQFLVDEDYDQIMGIHAVPEPDAIRRVYIIVEALTEEISINPQEFKAFERNGFTLVEWGGSILDSKKAN